MRTKSNIALPMLGAWILVIATIVSLSINDTYARYSTQISADKGYVADTAASAFIVDFDEDGERIQLVPNWNTKGGEQFLTLAVSNCNVGQDEAPSSDARFRIRVFVPERLFAEGNALDEISVGNLAMTLRIGDNPTVYYSKSDYLSTQTPMYDKQSENGWFFSFFAVIAGEDAESFEEEAVGLLKGGQISDIMITLTVQNTEIDCSGFRIMADRV